jgi:quinohemoprotein ethanol dehydrogenase
MTRSLWHGEWWKEGGSDTVWDSIVYDPDFNRVYLATANGARMSVVREAATTSSSLRL